MFDRNIRRVVAAMAAVGALVASAPALAHAFGQRYDLPVPLTLYLAAAGAAVVLSFIVIAAFARGGPESTGYPRLNLLRFSAGRALVHPLTVFAVKFTGVALFILILITGFLGEPYPTRNLTSTLVWIIWWVGLAYVSALLGNLWVPLNPWRSLFGWAETLYRHWRPGRELSLHLPYPAALGVWPAVVLLLAFGWAELVFHRAAMPAITAGMALGYSLITWVGMFLFGRERWLAHGEAFALAFGVLARFAPTEVRVSEPQLCAACDNICRDRDGECINCYACFARAPASKRELALRPFAVGLLREEPVSMSMTAFVLLMLSTILFDGFMATPPWAILTTSLYYLLPDFGGLSLMVIGTLGLIGFWLLFLTIYGLVCWFMHLVSTSRLPITEVARRFIFTLVPIAIAYHVAHYLTYLLIQGQLIIPLVSDPFGYGWNLFGTAGYRLNIAVVGARFAWYTAVVAIVTGHVIAIYLAHAKAARTFEDRRSALHSQYPMTTLMVAYTVCGLWILAQPIVEGSLPAQTSAKHTGSATVSVAPEALIPEAGSGRLREVGPGHEAALKLTYLAMLSSFHDGSRMSVADILYPYAFAYRWGIRSGTDDAHYDPYVDRATALMRKRLVGVHVAGVDTSRSIRFGDLQFRREMPIVEVYLSAGPRDEPLTAAAIAPPWSALPWELLVLMEETVERGWAAFSREEANRRSLPWLDLVRDEALKRRMLGLVEQFAQQGYRPSALEHLVSTQEARARWLALQEFYQQRGHFLVTNGPYGLKEWSRESVVLDVFRDPSYPLGVGSFDAYAIPLHAHIVKVEHTSSGLRVHAEVESVEKFQRTYDIVRKPVPASDSPLAQKLDCRYTVVAADGNVLIADRAPLQADGSFAVDLNGRLAPGHYEILLALYLNGNAMDVHIERIPYDAATAASRPMVARVR